MTTDRDGSIERLLRRAQAADRVPDGCPDPETLAALADKTLTAAARREVEAHVADCHRCQMVTAAMVRADVPITTTADEAAREIPAWRRRAFNWLVPAAAAATAVALWVLVPGQRTPLPEAPREEQKTAATSLPRSPEAPPTSQRVAEEPLRIPADSPAGAAADERDASARQSAAAAESRARSDTPQTGNVVALQDSRAAQANQAAAPKEERLAEAAAPAPSISPSSSVEGPAPPAAAPALAPLPPAAAPPPAPPPPAAAPPPPPPAAPIARRLEAAASFEVVSPNPRIRWRVGPGALVQYSADAGATWTMQTGVTANFTAGSAPAADVLWLVGPAGVVMRTTDAGRRWERTAFPEAGDLRAITASTALDATVDLADGRRFRTTDGGRTWAAVTP